MQDSQIAALREQYHRRLREGDAGAWHAAIQEAARRMGVTYGERTVCHVLEPFFLTRQRYELILRRAELVVQALHKAAQHARQNPALWSLLGFSPAEEELLAMDCGYRHHDQIARLDAFLNEDGEPVFMEYNGESPGGIAYGDSLGRAFDCLEPLQEVAATCALSRRPVTAEVVRTMRHTYCNWARAAGRPVEDLPQVAIVDLADIPTLGEFEIFRLAFENDGMSCRITRPEALEIRDGQLFCGDFRIDILYRRLLTADLLKHYPLDHVLVQAMRHNLAFVANGFDGYLLSHKGLFAILTDPALRPSNLTLEESAAVSTSLPWTRIYNLQSDPALRTRALSRQEHSVLKKAQGFGGQDVVLGWTVDRSTWEETLERAENETFVLQERLHIPTMTSPAWQDGELVFLDLRFDVDPYILDGRRAHGLGIRLAADDLLNVASGAGSAIPAYVLS